MYTSQPVWFVCSRWWRSAGSRRVVSVLCVLWQLASARLYCIACT
jgi:hypothetical protein